MVIQTGLPQADTPIMSCQPLDTGFHFSVIFLRIVRMGGAHGDHDIVTFEKMQSIFNRTLAVGIGHHNQSFVTGSPACINDTIPIIVKSRVIDVTMEIDQSIHKVVLYHSFRFFFAHFHRLCYNG